MSEFEFVFTLFGLLLGFSLVEVLGGLARTVEMALRAREPGGPTFRAGWLTPLFGIFVMLDILSFWSSAWLVRDQLQVTGPVLLGGLAFAGAYYLAAHLVFPDDLEAARDLDGHYFRVRRLVFGGLLLLTVIQIGWFMTLPEIGPRIASFRILGSAALLLGMMAAALLVRGQAASALLLTLLSTRYVVEFII